MIIIMLFILSKAIKLLKQLFYRSPFLTSDQNQPSQLGINARTCKHCRQTQPKTESRSGEFQPKWFKSGRVTNNRKQGNGKCQAAALMHTATWPA